MFQVLHASWLQLIEFHFRDLMNQLCRLVHRWLMRPVAVASCRSHYRVLRYCLPKAQAV
jgi:hypothetical protein